MSQYSLNGEFHDGRPRYRQIYEYLLKEITSGVLKPGDRIPSETELCAAFGVSRITSKKALEMLMENQLISRQRGKGSYVAGSPEPAAKVSAAAPFRLIALLISAFNDSFGNQLIHSIEETCEAIGYHLILKFTHESVSAEEKALRSLEDKNVAGVLMVPVHGEYYNGEILRQILNKRPLVFVDRRMYGLPVPSVSTNSLTASETVVKQLIRQGHRNIAFYSGPALHTSSVEDRLRGYAKAFSNSGVPINHAYICDSLQPADNLDLIIGHLTDHSELSAAFTAEFSIALEVKKALSILGKQLNRDFSLVSFDCPSNYEDYRGICCLKQDEQAIGRKAVEVLHSIIQGGPGQLAGDFYFPVQVMNELQ